MYSDGVTPKLQHVYYVYTEGGVIKYQKEVSEGEQFQARRRKLQLLSFVISGKSFINSTAYTISIYTWMKGRLC